MSLTSMIGSIVPSLMSTTGSTTTSVDKVRPSDIYDVDWGTPSLFEIESMHMIKPNANNQNNAKHFFRASTSGDMMPLLQYSVSNIETATITHTPIEEWIGGKWVYTTGRPEMRQITFTFRDTSEAWLYRNFNTAYNANRNEYPDSQHWTIKVWVYGASTTSLTLGRMTSDKENAINKGVLIETHTAILESVSSMQLDTSNMDGFLTFSVTFKYMNPIHNFDTLQKPGNAGITTYSEPSDTPDASVGIPSDDPSLIVSDAQSGF